MGVWVHPNKVRHLTSYVELIAQKSLRTAVNVMCLKRFNMAKSNAEHESSKPSGHFDELFLTNAIRDNTRCLNIDMVLRHLVARRRKVLKTCFIITVVNLHTVMFEYIYLKLLHSCTTPTSLNLGCMNCINSSEVTIFMPSVRCEHSCQQRTVCPSSSY